MPSVLAVAYDTTSGKWYVQKLGADQLSPGAIISGLLASGAIGSLDQIANNLFAGVAGLGKFADGFWSGSTALGKLGAGLFTADTDGRGKFANAFMVSSLIGAGAIGGGLIRNNDILSGKYASQSIRTADLGLGQVVSSIIGANIIATPHIANQGILSAAIGVGAIGHTLLRDAGIVSGKLASASIDIAAIPDSLITEAKLASGISIDIAESLSEPTTLAAEPIDAHACILFLSGYGGKRIGMARAGDPNRMPAVGKIGATTIASGASMTTNPLLSYGRQTSPILSGNAGRLAYVGTSSLVTVTPPSTSGSAIQVMGQVADNDGSIFLMPQPFSIQVAA